MNDPIIKAFDEIRDFIWGRHLGRDNPHKSDVATAKEWTKLGATVPICSMVFYKQMSAMHERWLRDKIDDKANIPHALKVFGPDVEQAVNIMKNGTITVFDNEMSRWQARLLGFKKTGNWLPDSWGPKPNEENYRGPKSLTEQLLK